MDPITPTKESGNAGKPGESTAAASSAAQSATIDPKNLTPAGVASLLDSAFAEKPESSRQDAGSTLPGQEVQPGGTDKTSPKEKTAEPQWTADQAAWFDLRAKATSPEEIAAADAQAPEFTPEQTAWIESQNANSGTAGKLPDTPLELPAEVLSQVQAWEDAGGALPPALQAIVDKRIGREVGKVRELEAKANQAEAEVKRLTDELATRGDGRPNAGVGGLDEKSLNQLVETSKKFQADARAFLGGYADEQQEARLRKHMEASGQDEKALRRQLDEVNDWLSQELPDLRNRVQTFRQTETQIAPIVTARFPSLDKKDTEEAQWAAEVARLVPELSSRTPAHKLALGVYALGKIAWDHLSKASADGDVIAALRDVLTRHVPVTANGNGSGKPRFFLPGKPPAKGPTGGRAFVAPRVNGYQAQEQAASEELRRNPTAENVISSLKIALR